MKPNQEFKNATLLEFITHTERELTALTQSAKAAHLAATHEESRAEDRHDTFAIEASYLAAGQAARVADLQASHSELKRLLESQVSHSQVDLGALVTLEIFPGNLATHALITRYGGGTQIIVNQVSVQLLSPHSPLGEHMMGLVLQDNFVLSSKSADREYTIVNLI